MLKFIQDNVTVYDFDVSGIYEIFAKTLNPHKNKMLERGKDCYVCCKRIARKHLLTLPCFDKHVCCCQCIVDILIKTGKNECPYCKQPFLQLTHEQEERLNEIRDKCESEIFQNIIDRENREDTEEDIDSNEEQHQTSDTSEAQDHFGNLWGGYRNYSIPYRYIPPSGLNLLGSTQWIGDRIDTLRGTSRPSEEQERMMYTFLSRFSTPSILLTDEHESHEPDTNNRQDHSRANQTATRYSMGNLSPILRRQLAQELVWMRRSQDLGTIRTHISYDTSIASQYHTSIMTNQPIAYARLIVQRSPQQLLELLKEWFSAHFGDCFYRAVVNVNRLIVLLMQRRSRRVFIFVISFVELPILRRVRMESNGVFIFVISFSELSTLRAQFDQLE